MTDEIQEKRLLRNNTSGRVRPNHMSPKLIGKGYCESMFEHNMYFAVDMDPQIVKYRVQPISFELLRPDGSGKTTRYTPDAALEYIDLKREFVEVKPEEKVNKKLKQKLACFSEQLVEKGLPPIRLITERDYSKFVQRNSKMIMHFYKVKSDKVLEALTKINPRSIRTFGELKGVLGANGTTLAYAALAHQFATVNLASRIDDNSHITWAGGRC